MLTVDDIKGTGVLFILTIPKIIRLYLAARRIIDVIHELPAWAMDTATNARYRCLARANLSGKDAVPNFVFGHPMIEFHNRLFT